MKQPKHYTSYFSGTLECLPVIVGLLLSAQIVLPDVAFADHLKHYDNHAELADSGESHDVVPELTLPGVKKVDKAHSYLSSTVESLSRRIDTFFGEDRVYEETTGTYVQARSNVILGENGDIEYDLKFRVKLRLPQLKSRFRLIFENVDDNSLVDEFNRDSKGSSLTNELESSDFSASLQYLLKQTDKLNISIRPGVKLSNPVEAFLRLRASKTVHFTDKWLSRGTAQVGYFSEDGWENDWKLEFERRMARRDFFRTTSNARWREDSPGNWFLGQTAKFTHIMSPRASIAYEVGVTGETKPTLHNTSYFANVRYRRDIHRGWLFMELRPRVVFAKENNYDEDVSLVLTLEILLGENYAH